MNCELPKTKAEIAHKQMFRVLQPVRKIPPAPPVIHTAVTLAAGVLAFRCHSAVLLPLVVILRSPATSDCFSSLLLPFRVPGSRGVFAGS